MKRIKTSENPLLVSKSIYEFISNTDVSDESIYLIGEFLTEFLAEFDILADGRIRRYLRKRERQKQNLLEPWNS